MAQLYYVAVLLLTVVQGRTVDNGTSPTQCSDAVQAMMLAGSPNFMRMVLASGKALPKDAGKYRMCMDVESARYFLVSMKGAMALPGGKPMGLPIEVGFCLPDKCDHAGVAKFVNSSAVRSFLPELTLPALHLSDIQAASPQLDLKSEDAIGITVAVFVGVLVCLVIVSSGVVLMQQTSQRRRIQQTQSQEAGQHLIPELEEETAPPSLWDGLAAMKLVQAFSLFGKTGTLTKLMEIPSYKPTDSLNGLRVLSMAWIILGHSFLMPEGISGYANQEDIVENVLNHDAAERNTWFSFVLSAQMGVDTFFYLSGFLLSYLTLKELNQNHGKVSLGKIIAATLMRYLRLTPSLALAMMIYYKIWVFFGYGPFAVRFQQSINQRCDGSWWSEILYTMNFAPFDSNKVCMGWTWYLGDDMIFFIITMFILPVYYHKRIYGWVCVAFITGLSFALTVWLILDHKLSIYVFDQHYTDYSYWAYSKPYTRIPAYFVGVVTAWILLELEAKGFIRNAQQLSAIRGMPALLIAFFAAAVLAFLVFIPITDFGDHKNSWGPVASVLYIVLSRPLWAMAFAALTLLCYYDCLPVINSFLSHAVWTPLARLTYGAYLCHPLVIKLAAGTSLQYYTFSGLDMFYRATGNCIMAFSGAVVLWVLVERPAMSLMPGARKSKPGRVSADLEKTGAPEARM